MARRLPQDARPLPQQARDAVLQLMEEEGYDLGDRLPSERQLAERLCVSRPTIRDALRILEEEGRVIRRVGSGTFVSSVPVVEAGLETLVSFTEMMARAGHEAGTGHLDVSEGEMSTKEAELFQVEVGTPKVVIERVRTMDGRPAMYSIHVSLKSLVGDPPPDEYRGSFFALLERRSGQRMSHSDTHVYSRLAGRRIGGLLGLPPGTPLLVLDEVVFSTDNHVMCTSLSYSRADINHYRIVRKRSGVG